MNTTIRRTLQPNVARRYEQDIARACLEAFTIRPWLCRPALRATTYISQFREARRAFRLGLLQSDLIPQGADLMLVRLAECPDGSVQVWNEAAPKLAQHNYMVDSPELYSVIHKLHTHALDGLKQIIIVRLTEPWHKAQLERMLAGKDIVMEQQDKERVRLI